MLTISKTTENGASATKWDIQELHLSKNNTMIEIYGFWDQTHYDNFINGTIKEPAGTIHYEFNTTNDPFRQTDNLSGVSTLISNGKTLLEIGKKIAEDFLISNYSEWENAVQS